MNPLNKPLKDLQDAFESVKASLPAKMGAVALEFIDNNFRAQGYQDFPFQPWEPRKDNSKSAGRAILVKTGRMRRGWRITRTTADSVGIGNSVPYTRVHNEGMNGMVNVRGFQRNSYYKAKVQNTTSRRTSTVRGVSGTHTVQAHTRRMNMPVRRMMGDSHVLNRLERNMIVYEINRAVKH